MSGALPTNKGFSSIRVINGFSVITQYSESGKAESRNTGGTYKEFELAFPAMKRADFVPYFAFFLKQKGSFESWTFINPETATPQGIATGTPLVNGAHSVGDTTIATDGWTVLQTGILKAGDIIKWAYHNLVYTVVEDADSDGTGATTITIDPPLEVALVTNSAITVNNVPYTVRLKDEIVEYRTTKGGIYTYAVKCREAK